jgi:hypothetical protein
VNGDAEAEVQDKEVPGWGDPQDEFTTPAYGSQGGEWDWGVSGCPGCGKQYFHLMWEGEGTERSFSQTVDVTAEAKAIDSGNVEAKLSGYFGGYRDGDTTDYLVAEFLDEGGQTLGSLVTRPVDTKVLPPPPVGNTSMMPIEAKGKLRAGTRRIVVTFRGKATGTSGSYLALGDNLALVLSPAK